VVLDEATSHLDSENEALIQQALAWPGRADAVVIAHRLSTIAAPTRSWSSTGPHRRRGRHADLAPGRRPLRDLFETQFRRRRNAREQ